MASSEEPMICNCHPLWFRPTPPPQAKLRDWAVLREIALGPGSPGRMRIAARTVTLLTLRLISDPSDDPPKITNLDALCGFKVAQKVTQFLQHQYTHKQHSRLDPGSGYKVMN